MDNKMKSSFLKIAIAFVLLIGFIIGCKDKKAKEETIIGGEVSILVDETIQSIVEEEVAVFESQYPAKIKQVNHSESMIINSLLRGKSDVAILSRRLTPQESKFFTDKKITPRITKFASDAIAFISNKSANDTIVELQEIINLMQGKPSKIKGLVFENPNSSTVRFMDSIASVAKGEKENIYSVRSHEEVLKYVSENSGVIGVVGLNMIVQTYPEWQKYLDKINVMAVKNVKNKPNSDAYYKPTQANIGTGLYPLRRDLYMLNYQGSAGLGMGFASFVAGDIGQKIVLKAGLLPVRVPNRNITVRKEIINNK